MRREKGRRRRRLDEYDASFTTHDTLWKCAIPACRDAYTWVRCLIYVLVAGIFLLFLAYASVVVTDHRRDDVSALFLEEEGVKREAPMLDMLPGGVVEEPPVLSGGQSGGVAVVGCGGSPAVVTLLVQNTEPVPYDWYYAVQVSWPQGSRIFYDAFTGSPPFSTMEDEVKTGQPYKGEMRCHLLETVGNPRSRSE